MSLSPPSEFSENASESDSTSVSLIERVRRRDEAAWRRLVDLYGPLVFTWCRQWGLRADECADLMQEVFSSVAKGIAGFRRDSEGDSFRGWLRVIARNATSQYLRQQARQPRAVGGSSAHQRLQELDSEPPQDVQSDLIERSTIYRRALDLIQAEFEPTTWQAFLASVLENRSAADIADELQMTPGGVRQAKYRVLRKLRVEFGDLF